MADVNAGLPLRFDVEWEAADGAQASELDATWCNLQIWIGDRCLTRVDSADSGVRQGVHTSAYPLAEWLAYNWWSLTEEVSPSANPSSSWTWSEFARSSWLARHNLRAAGAGMPWPDLTIVPEGGFTAIRWRGGPGVAGQPVRFLETGYLHVESHSVQRTLRRFIQQVIDRLEQVGMSTLLQKEWEATLALDSDEIAFARAAAKLGLDPFDVPEPIADDLIVVSEGFPAPLLDEFLDSADPSNLRAAVRWLDGARSALARSSRHQFATPVTDLRVGSTDIPPRTPAYQRGYDLARGVREQLGREPADRFEIEEFVTRDSVDAPAAGLQGFVKVGEGDHVGLVLPGRTSLNAERFSQARALGLALSGSRREYLLDPAHTDLMKLARAFAAEVLAPASGIQRLLAELRYQSDDAFEAIANRYSVSPLLVKYQYENQLLANAGA